MCELCNFKKKTKWYYEDRDFIICGCLTCKIPMIVSKEHGQVGNSERNEAYFTGLVSGVFYGKDFSFRKEQRKIKDHWHWHIILE